MTPSAPRANKNWRKVVSWAMWDWGAQPFQTVITTFVFSVYLTSKAFGDTNSTSQALSLSTMLAGIVVALVAPVVGQNSDRTGHTVRNLRWLTWALAILSASLFFIAPSPEYLWPGLILLAIGGLANEFAQVNYYALIDEVSTPDNVGRVSGFGWGMGYLGGIIALLALYVMFIAPDVGMFGVTNANGMDIRVSMLFCGMWTLVFTLPTFVALKDRPRAQPAERIGVAQSYRLLGRSIVDLWRTDRHTLYFLGASALFRDGLNAIFTFGAVLAAGSFGFSSGEVIIFGAVASVVAGVSTMLLGLFDDKIGPKKVILIALSALIALGTGIFVFHTHGKTMFWVLGLAMTAFVGPAQSASRSFLARIAPEGKSGELFGLYATTGRAVSFVAPAFFMVSISLGAAITGEANTQYWGIVGIVAVLTAGFLVLLPVRDPQHTR